MVVNELLIELKKFLEIVIKDYNFKTNKQDILKEPQVVLGYLPFKGESENPDYPYIIIRAVNGVDDKEKSIISINIILGIYSEDNDGWEDIINVCQRVRQALLDNKTLANKFCLEQIEWEIFEEQTIPEWNGILRTLWSLPMIEKFWEVYL